MKKFWYYYEAYMCIHGFCTANHEAAVNYALSQLKYAKSSFGW